MVKGTLEGKISDLLDEVIILSSMVEKAIYEATDAFVNFDLPKAKLVYAGDKLINSRRYQLEEETIAIIARHQPMARDVRILSAILEVLTELERMGDYAKGIAKILTMLNAQKPLKPMGNYLKMASITIDMLKRAIKAFVEVDEKTALEIPKEDDKVDEIFNIEYRETVDLMLSNRELIDDLNYLVWANHNLERVADRVTNICERTIYVATGLLSDLDESDDQWL